MGVSVSKIGQEVSAQVRKMQSKNQKQIVQGLNYTQEAIQSAICDEPNNARFIRSIQDTIDRVDEFIKTNRMKISTQDREDMIQEAFLARLEAMNEPGYAELKNHSAKNIRAVGNRLSEMQKQISQKPETIPLQKLSGTCTVEDNIAQVQGIGPTREIIDDVLDTISPRQWDVITRRTGYYTGKVEKHGEIGKLYSCSPNTIHGIEERALSKLRSKDRAKILKGEIFVAPNGALYTLKGPKKVNQLK